MIERQISKTPEPPKFINNNLRSLLTKLCFGENTLINPVDLIFVYGTPYFITEISNHIVSLLNRNLANKVLITGGMMPHGESHRQQKSEARLIYNELILNNFHNIEFFLEEKSQNTLENVTEGLKILDFSHYKSICFVFPAHGARRGYLTLRKFCPTGQLISSAYDVCYPGEEHKISKDNWYISESGIKRVWGEFLRIKQYGSRGDIAYDEVKHIIIKIDKALL